MPNITQIPPPRVELIDSRTGLMSREWYRFFMNIYTLVGGGTSDTSLTDLQVGPVTTDLFDRSELMGQADLFGATLTSVDQITEFAKRIDALESAPVSNPITVIAETGTFTPVVKDAAAGNAATAGTSLGRFTKLANRVFFDIALVDIDTTGLTAGNQVFVTGMPYPSANNTGMLMQASVVRSAVAATTGAVSATMDPNVSYLQLVNNTTTGNAIVPVSAITSTTGDLYISGFYEALL